MVTHRAVAGETPASAQVGATVGIEEEYHIVDARTFEVRDSPELSARLASGALGPRLHPEIATTQIEVATDVCETLADVRGQLLALRREAAVTLGSAGATILAASTHPNASWDQQRLTLQPRYLEILERWGLMALQQVICGCHVHVSVPDLDTAVAVLDRVRPHLAVLLALTGSSPFHERFDTGHESYRTQWFARWPIAGPTEPMGDAATYLSVVDGLCRAGVIDDASNLYWDVRPSARYPTLEFRVADVCTSVDDAVLHAALVRALAVTAAAQARRGEPPLQQRPELLRAARWQAARHGISGRLLDPTTGELVEPRWAVQRLLVLLTPALAERGELEEVRRLLRQVFERGTSARRQRAVLQRTSDPQAVARFLVTEGLRECRPAVAATGMG